MRILIDLKDEVVQQIDGLAHARGRSRRSIIRYMLQEMAQTMSEQPSPAPSLVPDQTPRRKYQRKYPRPAEKQMKDIEGNRWSAGHHKGYQGERSAGDFNDKTHYLDIQGKVRCIKHAALSCAAC